MLLDKQFKIFSILILLFMILCFLYSKNNSLLLSGGNKKNSEWLLKLVMKLLTLK